MHKSKDNKRKSLITDDHIIDALSKANGIKSQAARILDMSSSWMTDRCQKSEKIQAHCLQLIQDRIDRAEQALDRLLENDNSTACIFTLKTIGRGRGYIEHAPLEEVDSAALNRLEQFFSSIGKGKPPSPASKSDEPKDPDLLPEKTSDLATNFP